MKFSWFVFLSVTLTLSMGCFTMASASIIAPGAQVQKILTGYSFTEGPAVDAAGNLFFTDQPNDRIMKLSTDGTVSVFLSPCGRANGLYFDREGNLWSCSDYHNELWRIDPQGNVTVVITNFQGKLLNGPNDLWIMRNGGLYITDPLFNRSYWDHRSGKALVSGQQVYYLTPDTQTLVQATNDLQQPNGIIGTIDGHFLYVADYGAAKTYRYAIQPNGTLNQKTLFCSQGSDGMTIDQEGNVYFTGLPSPGTFVTVYNSLGTKIETINIPEQTSNVTFGGADHKTLYITAKTSVYSLKMSVQGAFLSPDLNNDKRVDFQDYVRLAQSWKKDDPNVDLGPTTLGDGIIDARDMAILTENWLKEVGLQAHWKLDESDGAIAHDSAGTYNAEVMGNPLWQPGSGMVKGALVLDGNDDYISTPYILNPANGGFSVFTWVKGGAPGQVILSQKGNKNILSADESAGFLMIELKSAARGSQALISQTVITDSNWHHVGLVWDGLYRALYVDGAIAAKDATEHGKLLGTTNGFYIGAGKGLEAGSFWSGLIDDVRIYDRAVVAR